MSIIKIRKSGLKTELSHISVTGGIDPQREEAYVNVIFFSSTGAGRLGSNFTPDEAVAFAMEILTQAVQAKEDTLVWRTLEDAGIDDAVSILQSLRSRR